MKRSPVQNVRSVSSRFCGPCRQIVLPHESDLHADPMLLRSIPDLFGGARNEVKPSNTVIILCQSSFEQ